MAMTPVVAPGMSSAQVIGGAPISTTNNLSSLTSLSPGTSGQDSSTAGSVASLLQMFGSLYGLYGSTQLNSAAQGVLSQSDPFASSRPAYVNQLNALMANPSSVTSTPGYEFLMGQGVQAIDRSAAAPGGVGLGSGGEMQALEQYGQGLASSFYQTDLQNLMQLSGANFPPANPAQALSALGGAQGSLGSSIAGVTNSIPSAVNSLSNLLSGGVSGVSASQWGEALSGLDQSTAATAASDAASSGMYTYGSENLLDPSAGLGDSVDSLFGFSPAGGGAATGGAVAGGEAAAAGGLDVGLTDIGGSEVAAATASVPALPSSVAAAAGAEGGADAGAAAATGSLGLGLLGVGAVLAPVLYGMSQPAYTVNQTAYARTNAAMQQGFQPGQAGWGVLEQAAMDPNAVTPEMWDQFAQYGINKGNLMQMYSKYASMGATSAAMGGLHYGGGGV